MLKIKDRPADADYIQCCNPILIWGNEAWSLGVGCEDNGEVPIVEVNGGKITDEQYKQLKTIFSNCDYTMEFLRTPDEKVRAEEELASYLTGREIQNRIEYTISRIIIK